MNILPSISLHGFSISDNTKIEAEIRVGRECVTALTIITHYCEKLKGWMEHEMETEVKISEFPKLFEKICKDVTNTMAHRNWAGMQYWDKKDVLNALNYFKENENNQDKMNALQDDIIRIS